MNIKDKLLNIKRKYVVFYNDGNIRREDADYVESTNTKLFINDDNYGINDVLENAVKHYDGFGYAYDKVDMTLTAGIIYKDEDVNPDNTLKEGVKPINKVHYYTGHVSTYENDEKTNKHDYYNIGFGRQTFVDYDKFVSDQIKQGFTYNGPQTFEELKNSILSGSNEEISISLNLEPEIKLIRR